MTTWPGVLRPALASDWPDIRALLTASGLPLASAEDHLAHFVLATAGDVLAGVAGLEIHGDLALLRSVAVAADARGQGLAQALVTDRLRAARQQRLRQVFLLTTTAQRYFPRFGFVVVPRADTPAGLLASAEFTGACPDSAVLMGMTPGETGARERAGRGAA